MNIDRPTPQMKAFKNYVFFASVSCLLLLNCSAVEATQSKDFKFPSVPKLCAAYAPHSLANLEVVLQIENTETQFPSGYPYKGAVVANYNPDGTWHAQGTSTQKGDVDPQLQSYHGTYKYFRTSENTGIEKSVDVTVNNATYVRKYTFETPTSGKWEEDFNKGQLKLSGSFSMVAKNISPNKHLAPDSHSGVHVALIINETKSDLPDGVYPKKGLVLQTYAANGTLTFKGFGPGTLNSTGTYRYTKISANTAVEEVVQTSDYFVYPYTMVYTFETPTSGKWFQNFADGLIKFSGTFDMFPQ